MKYILYLIILLTCNNLFSASKAEKYYALLQKGENKLILKDLDSALYYYDKAIEDYNYPFYKHVKQAAIIEFFNKAKNDKYLRKCIEKGMNIEELAFFRKHQCYDSLLNYYRKYRLSYSSGIDTIFMEKMIELDVIDREVNLIAIKSKQNRKDKEYIHLQSNLKNRYIELISEYGYPSEMKVGLSRILFASEMGVNCQKKNCLIDSIKYNKDLVLPTTQLKYSTIEASGIRRPEAIRPGNTFLWHYTGGNSNDEKLIEILKNGVLNLKIYPVNLVSYYESFLGSEETFDCACTYKSQFLINKNGLYSLPNDVKLKINSNRQLFFIRTIDAEEKLFRALYKIDTGDELRKISKRKINKIRFVYDSFISYI